MYYCYDKKYMANLSLELNDAIWSIPSIVIRETEVVEDEPNLVARAIH